MVQESTKLEKEHDSESRKVSLLQFFSSGFFKCFRLPLFESVWLFFFKAVRWTRAVKMLTQFEIHSAGAVQVGAHKRSVIILWRFKVKLYWSFAFQWSKPIMEKRRRERINRSLEELKRLVLEAQNRDVSMLCRVSKKNPCNDKGTSVHKMSRLLN